ncbi:hypothetical protein P7C73_g592, partial [Tremellales sp. Uapishka_1]
MSASEQDALMAFFNSFKLSRRITAFEQLADGKALMEVMSTMKRLYRLLLAFPLPSPHPGTLGLSSLPEPHFTVISKSPGTAEGLQGLLQICRFCLAIGVWAPGNEKVIERIQKLEETQMAELMRSIEGIMDTLPGEKEAVERLSPVKPIPEPSSPVAHLRTERDRILQDNDELRAQCEQLMSQVADLTEDLDEARVERDEANARLAARLDTSTGPGAGLRNSTTAAASEVGRLQADLTRAEDSLVHTEADLAKQTAVVEELKTQAAEAAKLKDQLDEYRHTAEKLQKSENVIEKYKKKLEESAGLRRELRSLEEENASLVDTNATLDAELKRVGSSKTLLDNYRSQIEALEKKTSEQATTNAELQLQLEVSQSQLIEMETVYEQGREELQLHQERLKEIELGATPGMKRRQSSMTLKTSLDDEIGVSEDGPSGASDTKTDLRIRVRKLQRELEEAKSSLTEGRKIAALESLLSDANKARDRYQAEYLEAHRGKLMLQANLEQIRCGKGGDNEQTASALRQRLNEVLDERDRLLLDKTGLEVTKDSLEKEISIAKTDLSLVNQDQKDILASLKNSVKVDTAKLDEDLVKLRNQVENLKEKDRLHLEEIKKLLMEKVDLQSSGIDQREKALEREKDLGELRASMAKNGVPQETQRQMLDLHERNIQLSSEVKALGERLQKAKDFIRNQDALFKADRSKAISGDFAEAQRSYEVQISSLTDALQRAKATTAALEKRYKAEQQLMLSAWHEYGSRNVRDHMAAASVKRSQPKPMPLGWLGRQRKQQEDASFVS